MKPLETALTRVGYRVVNVDYPSRKYPVERLAELAVGAGIMDCETGESKSIHFVTHSLGGILLRYYLEKYNIKKLGRVVMLAPPNGGSEVVDNLKDMPGFRLLNGPAGAQLGTDPGGIPAALGPVSYPVGVIAGTQTVNLLLSRYLSNPDDGKVSVDRTKVAGMTDFIEISSSHPFIMKNADAIRQTIAFLKSGAFIHDSP